MSIKKLISYLSIFLILSLSPFAQAGGVFGNINYSHIAYMISTGSSYTIPESGWYRISALGGGASGGAIFAYGGAASGGGGGGFTETEIYLWSGDVILYSVGTGGAAVTSSISGTGASGTTGGNTTLTCSARSLSLYANGGGAGWFNIGSGGTAPGGTGGTASGGTINSTGGVGGSAQYAATSGTYYASGGGAAGSPFGTGGRGGNITQTNTGATGGGAVGGWQGGDLSSNAVTNSGGAGTGGNAVNNAAIAGVNALGFASKNSTDGIWRQGGVWVTSATTQAMGFDSLVDPFRALTGGGAAGANSTGGGSGAGGGAAASGWGGVLGGSSGNTGSGVGCNNYLGGGGGADAYSASATSGAGGNGLIAVERIS